MIFLHNPHICSNGYHLFLWLVRSLIASRAFAEQSTAQDTFFGYGSNLAAFIRSAGCVLAKRPKGPKISQDDQSWWLWPRHAEVKFNIQGRVVGKCCGKSWRINWENVSLSQASCKRYDAGWLKAKKGKQQKRKLPSPQMALLAIVEAIVDGLVFSQDEDVVAQWTSMLFLSSLSQRWTGF